MPELRIIHTSDFHDSLTPAIAARLRALKQEHQALLIDTGDAIRAPNVAFLPWRERAIHLMNEAGYDAMGLGNREYFFRARGMGWKTGHARFPRVASNLRAVRGALPGIAPSAVLTAPSGLRVGLLALMPTMIEPGHWFERLSDTRFVPWQEAAREAYAALSGQCDLLVALFHRPGDKIQELLLLALFRLLAEEIEELAAVCPEIGLILAGHAHWQPGKLELTAVGTPISYGGECSTHAHLIGLHLPDKTVTMDELISLRE